MTLVTIPRTITVYDVEIKINKKDLERLAKVDGVFTYMNGFDEPAWLIVKTYPIRDYDIKLKVQYDPHRLWVGLELVDDKDSYITERPLNPQKILDFEPNVIPLIDDRKDPKKIIRFHVSYVLDSSVESCLDSNPDFLDFEKDLPTLIE